MHPPPGPGLVLAFGALYGRVAHFAPRWAALTVAVLGATIALGRWRCRRSPAAPTPRSSRLAAYLLGRSAGGRDRLVILLGCAGLLLALDYDGFTEGFFRQDDFAFVQDAREGIPLMRQIRLYHNDHSLPLYRVEVSAMVAAAGPGASASGLAAIFNLANFLTYLGVLLGGCWVLAELSARRATLAAFALFAWLWPGWGEFTSGLYTISVYPQTMLFGFAAVALWLRGARTGRGAWFGLGLLAAAGSASLDISGVWIFPVLAAFAWADRGRPDRKSSGVALAGLAVVFALAAAYHLVLAKHSLVGRELVQNPQARLLSYGRPQIAALLSWKTVRAMIFGLGGTILSTFTSPVLQILGPHLDNHPLYGSLFAWADLGATAGLALIFWKYARRLPTVDRRLFLAALWPVVLATGMSVVARPLVVGQPGLLWPTKYFPLPYCWLVLAAVLLVDRLAFRDPAAAGRALRRLGSVAILGVWLCLSQWYLERAMALTFPWMPGGRYHNSHVAVLRRADFAAFQGDTARLAALAGTTRLALPKPTGGFWYYPFLEEGEDRRYGSTYYFADLLAVAPEDPVTLSARPLAAVPPATLAALRRIPELDGFFESETGPPAAP
jgi:hypothetical protein